MTKSLLFRRLSRWNTPVLVWLSGDTESGSLGKDEYNSAVAAPPNKWRFGSERSFLGCHL